MPTNLKNKPIYILGSSDHENSIVVNTEVQNGYCVKYSILGDNDWLSVIFYLDI